MNIFPAIIPESFEDLESHLIQVKGIVREVQIDICDGRLTPSSSWPYDGDNGEFEEILAQQRGLPFWESFDFEIDLMVQNPVLEYEKWIEAGASGIIFHYKESLKDALVEIMNKTKERGVEIGLALHLSDSEEVIEPFKEIINSIQLMGIERIGFQGEKFDERVIEKIKKIKENYPLIPISVDGGVNTDTAPAIVSAGATKLIVGSDIYRSFDIRETINYFKSLS